MQGSGGAFHPQGTYTREQAVLTLLRLYANAPVSRGEGNIRICKLFTGDRTYVRISGAEGIPLHFFACGRRRPT